MAHVISVVNQKGGVGKTTTSINVAAYLAKKGKFVLLVDMDPQCNATSGLGNDLRALDKGMYEVLTQQAEVKDIIKKTGVEGFHLAPSTLDMAGVSVELVGQEEREFFLSKALLDIRNNYDFIIIDCPPSLGMITVNCLLASDSVLIPVQTEYYALEGLGQLLNTLELVKENVKPELDVLGAVMTMYDRRNLLSWQVKREMVSHFPYKVFHTAIPRNIRLAESPSHGQTIVEYAPSSSGARAYAKLVDEILNTFVEEEA
jgi:chromosome partitioning protein